MSVILEVVSHKVNPNDPLARQLCPEVTAILVRAHRAGDSDELMGIHDEAIGHQIMCRYYSFGHTDYDEAIKQVHAEADRLGVDYPYRIENGNHIQRTRVLNNL